MRESKKRRDGHTSLLKLVKVRNLKIQIFKKFAPNIFATLLRKLFSFNTPYQIKNPEFPFKFPMSKTPCIFFLCNSGPCLQNYMHLNYKTVSISQFTRLGFKKYNIKMHQNQVIRILYKEMIKDLLCTTFQF